MRHAKEYKRGVKVKASIFFGVLFLIMVVSLIIPLRPTESAVEKRSLTKFPEFSANSLLSGEFFHGIDSWFSDTFPGRELCIAVNNQIRSLYGFKQTEIHGTIQEADDIPDTPFTGK